MGQNVDVGDQLLMVGPTVDVRRPIVNVGNVTIDVGDRLLMRGTIC